MSPVDQPSPSVLAPEGSVRGPLHPIFIMERCTTRIPSPIRLASSLCLAQHRKMS